MSLIEVRGLCKAFGENRVLSNIDLTVEQGERIAIIGASGCGHSATARISGVSDARSVSKNGSSAAMVRPSS